MRRSRTDPYAIDNFPGMPSVIGAEESESIVRSIASFLTLSDVASLSAAPFDNENDGMESPTDSWAVGIELGSLEDDWTIEAPPTPALVAISPGATPAHILEHGGTSVEDLAYEDQEEMENVLHERRRSWAQQKLTDAIFAHPRSLRSFCVEAYSAAQGIRARQEARLREFQANRQDPELAVEPIIGFKRKRQDEGLKERLITELVNLVFHNVPLSVLLDVVETTGHVSLDTSFACFTLSRNSINALISAVTRLVQSIWHGITNFNPFELVQTIISLQFNAMGKTSEAIVSGIQSVATGVGSASSHALHRLSGGNLAGHQSGSASSLMGEGLFQRKPSRTKVNTKLLKKLSDINDAARLVAYQETSDDTGGLSRQGLSRVHRTMHYPVSLRPFVATVEASRDAHTGMPQLDDIDAGINVDGGRQDENGSMGPRAVSFESVAGLPSPEDGLDDNSPFISTPQSFPATPRSRENCITMWSHQVDDHIFEARDKLRVYHGTESSEERTRGMANLLKGEKRLAIFDDTDISHGIELSCGKHVARKTGTFLFCSVRSEVAILRNSYVYFEITVLPGGLSNPAAPSSMVTLSVGLATGEMPSDRLVGTWPGSVGLFSTGQIQASGQSYKLSESGAGAFGEGATVGCLAFIDEELAYETWDGVMEPARVVLTVNGRKVIPTLDGTSGTTVNPTLAQAIRDSSSEEEKEDDEDDISTRNPSVQEPSLQIDVPASEDLYPTVTLHSPATTVMSRFSAEDIGARSREETGAPSGATVYAVDGSVLFD